MDPKMLPTIWGTYMKLVTKYQISAINSCWEKCAYMFNVYYWWQKSDIWSQASYRYPIWWEAFFDPSDSYFLFAVERRYHKWALAHSSSCICKQEAGIWRVQRRYPQYGIPIWSLWPKIRFLPSTVTEKNATKNILDGRKDEQRCRFWFIFAHHSEMQINGKFLTLEHFYLYNNTLKYNSEFKINKILHEKHIQKTN
jgi:hypothetical protein